MAKNWFEDNAPKEQSSSSSGGGWFTANAPSQDFSANDQGEGTYQMKGKGGVLHVPFSHVESASKSGFKMTDEDRARYVKDAAADPNLKDLNLPDGVKAVGRNSAGEPILDSESGPSGSSVGRFLSSAGSAIADAGKGMYNAVVQGPQNPEEAEVAANGMTGRLGLIAKRTIVDPAIQQGKEAGRSDIGPLEGAAHALASVIPMVGPWAAQVGEEVGQQAGSGDYAGAAGTFAGNAALYEAPHLLGKAAGLVVKPLRSVAEAVTKTGPREIKKMATETAKGNEAAVKVASDKDVENVAKHADASYDAAHETRGKEIQHDIDLKTSKAEADAKNAAAAAQHLKELQDSGHDTQGLELAHQYAENAANEAAKSEHALEVAKTDDANARTLAKHQAESSRMKEENDALDHQLEMRRQEEAALKEDTDAYYAKEDATKVKAKGVENSKWEPWHEKMRGVTVDGGEIAGPLNKIIEISPEVRRVIHQLTPDPGDAAPDSMFAQDRAAVMKSQGITGSYWDLPADRRAIIDQITASSGFEPEPIDFHPEAGKGIPIEQIHRAQSIINRNLNAGRYEGPLEGEMKQLVKVLDQAKTRASMNAGALDDLKAAKQATIEYQKAFGKERPTPKTVDNLRMKGANPEQFLEEHDQARLDAAKVHDPSLVEDFKRVKGRRDALKKMKTEDQLRQSLHQIPPPPTVGDLREGYNLKPPPPPPEPIKLKQPERVEPPNRQPTVEPTVPKPPDRNLGPDKPAPVKPDTKHISPEDVRAQKAAHVENLANNLREMGLRRAMYASVTGLTGLIASFFVGHPGIWALADVGAGGTVLAGSHALASLLEKPAVVDWLSKVTPKDVAQWEKLPPDEKAVFTKDMGLLTKGAKEKGLSVSPALTAFVTSSAASQQPSSLSELKEEAARRNPNAVKVVAPDGSTHFFPDEQAASNFRKEAGIQ